MHEKDILRMELIGNNIKIGNAFGKIIDETKNLIVVETKDGKKKKLLKKNNFFELSISNNTIKIDGNKLLSRPEDRIKIR